jgi:SSS family solute:Na+ symporter
MIDLTIVLLYLGGMLAVGWRSRRQSADSFWVAKRQYGSVSITASLVATVFGASSTIGIIGLGYARGLTGAWWALIGAVALLPFALVLASRVRALNVYTLPDILTRAYGKRVAIPAGVVIAVAWCGVVAAQMVAGARLMTVVLPVGYPFALALVAVSFVLYTLWGGQLSVIRTDTWQLALFLLGLGVCVAFLAATSSASGASVWERIPHGHLRFPISPAFGWYDLLVFYPLVVGLPFLAGPDIYSRALCAKDPQVARTSALAAAAVIAPLSVVLALAGTVIRARFPDLLPEAALPTAIGQLIPLGLKGLIVAGFLAAIMSSADTTLVSASTILTLNVIDPLNRSSLQRQLALTRTAVVVVGAVAWLLAGLQQGIISLLLLAYTVFVGGAVMPTLASFYQGRLRVTPSGAMWAVIVGGTTAILGEVLDGRVLQGVLGASGDRFLSGVLGPEYTSILPLVLSLTIMLVVRRPGRRREDEGPATHG